MHKNAVNFDETISFIIDMMANEPEKWYYIMLALRDARPLWLRQCVRNLPF